jgi:hypothetical protein
MLSGQGRISSSGGGKRGAMSFGGDGSGNDSGLPGYVDGTVDLWRFEVPGVGLIAPHVAGILRKPL